MRKPIKGVLSSLIADINAGLIPRRTLLKQAARLGLTGSILGLLESCSIAPMPCSATTLTWWSEYDNIGTYKALVDAYNAIHDCEISVSYPYTKGLDTDSLHQQLTQRLQSRKYNAGDPDIISMDIIWTDEFASNGWIVPLNDFWPAKEQSLYLSLPIQSSTYQGKIYAAPFRTDVGLMYYRTDLGFPDPIPQTWTWNDLEYMVQNARSHNNSGMPQYGYLWQVTDQLQFSAFTRPYYEGLVCNFVEILSSYGGSIIDPHDPERVTISGAAAGEALRKMRSWLSAGNPSHFDFTTSVYDEDSTVYMWEGGNAMFMRNWPTYIVDSNKDTSKVQQKFGIMTLPYGDGDKGRIGRSCIGGWGLAINAFTPQEKREAAWNFIHWMLQEDIQVFAAIDAAFTATRLSVYDNSYLKEQNPFYSKIIDMINHYSQARPQLANYQPFSSAIQASIYQILTEPSPDIHGSLNTLQETLQGIIDKGKKGYK